MPPLTTLSAGALVGGGVPTSNEETTMSKNASAPPATVRGTVLRAFYFQSKTLAKGESVELPRIFALEMKAANKFTVDEAPPAPPAPAPEANTAAPSQPETRARKKGDSDAR